MIDETVEQIRDMQTQSRLPIAALNAPFSRGLISAIVNSFHG
ncbi:hypothetical protein SAMN04487948_11622 [Halogranum amylolyticum]|uniref:Uncharacterized protein n=1 Tax=Halogranum amylolyticum TaxID=660520 RepID=A0A1H8VED0_9EURY|nr:hypothetical protein SAMN04487948_11622 [Halogranum amylolyticum]